MTKEWAPVRPFEAWPEVEPIRYDTRQGTYVPDDSIEDRSVNRVAMAKVLGRGVRKLDVSTQGLTAGTYQKVNLPATDYDRSGFVTSTVGRLAFPVPGLYVLSAWGRFNLNVNGGYRGMEFLLNNATEEIGRQEVLASTVSLTYVSITAVLNTAGPRKFSGTGTIGPYENVELWAYTSVAPADLLSVEFSIALLGRM